jgi:hypothetical protein
MVAASYMSSVAHRPVARRSLDWLRRLRLTESLPASLADTAWAGVVLLVLGIAVYGSHIRHGGYHYDDWANYAVTHYSYGGGFFGGLHGFWDLASYRPGTALYYPVVETVFGLHMHWHLAWAMLLGVGMSLAFYHLLRMLSLERLHAGVIAALALVFPYSDATRLWAVSALSSWAIGLFLVGLILALYGLSASGRRALLLQAGALVFYLASVLTYELTAPPIVLSILLYRTRAPWRQAVKPWALQAAATVIVVATVNSHSNLHKVETLSGMWDHVKLIWHQGFALFSLALAPSGFPGQTTGFMLLLVVAGGALLVWRLLPRGDANRADIGRWLWVVAGAVVTIVAGYIMFIPADPYFSPGQLGVGNRVNAFATLGYVLAVYALWRLAGLMFFRGLPRGHLLSLVPVLVVSGLVGAAYISKLRDDGHDYDRAYVLEREVIGDIHTLVPRPGQGSTIYTFDHPGFYTPGVPVFSATWDLNGAVKIEFHNGSLSGQPILQGLTLACTPTGVTPTNGAVSGLTAGGVTQGQVPYGKAYAVSVGKQRAIPITSRAACQRVNKEFTPGVNTLLPAG